LCSFLHYSQMKLISAEGLVQTVVDMLESHRDTARAKAMSGYMKNQFTFYGIPAPVRTEVVKEWHKTCQIKCLDRQLVRSLWSKPEREAQYFAMDHIKRFKKQLGSGDIDWIEQLVLEKSWWDTVDFLAVHAAGEVFSKDIGLRDVVAEKWISSDNFWLVRTAILFQLKYKKQTDFERLQRYILMHIGSKEFFINKASGWALREYARTNPVAVIQFVEGTPELSNLP
jgi:3-methyladenine DNA glycosylase AlkD